MHNSLAQLPTVPGVYFNPRPRSPEAPLVRTDVAGFIGFEPRVANGTRPSRLTGDMLQGHEFNVDISGFYLNIGSIRLWIPPVTNLSLSSDTDSIPINDGEGIVYSLVTARTASGTARLLVLAGESANRGLERPLSDDTIQPKVTFVTESTVASSVNGGHEFNIEVSPFHLEIGSAIYQLAGESKFILSSSTDSAETPIENGQAIFYALVAVAENSTARLIAIPSAPNISGSAQLATDAKIRTQTRGRDWVHVTDVQVVREGTAITIKVDKPQWIRIANIQVARVDTKINVTVIPSLPPVCLEDWKDYVLRFGLPRSDGTLLAPAVRAFFANGGRRCYVTTVYRPDFVDTVGLQQALEDMAGIKGSSELEATGLERLLLISEVSIVDVPDLYASRAADPPGPFDLPPVDEAACFIECEDFRVTESQTARGRGEGIEPLFDDTDVRDVQTRMLYRCIDERWRVFLLLNVPMEYDPTEGRFRGPGKEKASEWREYFASIGEDPQKMSCSGLYFPWVLSQERVDAAVVEMPPTPFVAGVMARRDLARGPHVSPANETVHGVVGLTWPIEDKVNAELYEPPSNINILRPFAGYGVQLWGARTLSSDCWLRYVAVRRCLSAIERRAVIALQPLVFEPNTPMLWLQVSQLLLDILLPVFESGALRGKRPDEAFYIRCDASVNPPEQIEQGMLVCEVGVAIAAPAEFIMFRLGRREGVVEIME